MLWIIEDIEALDAKAVLSLLPSISEARRTRVLAMAHEPTAVRSILAELLLRYALREEFGITELPRIETGEKGKPFFPDHPDWQFSLSHCQSTVACALDAMPVGVDVQELRSIRKDKHCLSAPAIYRILSENERAWVEAGESPSEQDRRFAAVWTCKEAWGKAIGVGFLYDLRSTSFCPERKKWRQNGFQFHHISCEKYELTLCASRSMACKRISYQEIKCEVPL